MSSRFALDVTTVSAIVTTISANIWELLDYGENPRRDDPLRFVTQIIANLSLSISMFVLAGEIWRNSGNNLSRVRATAGLRVGKDTDALVAELLPARVDAPLLAVPGISLGFRVIIAVIKIGLACLNPITVLILQSMRDPDPNRNIFRWWARGSCMGSIVLSFVSISVEEGRSYKLGQLNAIMAQCLSKWDKLVGAGQVNQRQRELIDIGKSTKDPVSLAQICRILRNLPVPEEREE